MDLQRLEGVGEALPEAIRDEWAALAEAAQERDDRLAVVFLGAFSAGKSSLANALLGRELLPTAPDETTSVPTLVEWGEAERFLLTQEGRPREVSREEFQLGVTQTPTAERVATVRLPLPVLDGLVLVDLPGLGSTSESRRAYTRAQVRAADAVIYIIWHRGPSREDLHSLREIQVLGKRVQVVVSRWDEVEAARETGNAQPPSLEEWQEVLRRECQLDATLLPVSKQGIGIDTLVGILRGWVAETARIRDTRLRAEARPLVERGLAQLEMERKVLLADSDEERRRLDLQLSDRRIRLLEARRQLSGRREEERKQFVHALGEVQQATERDLTVALAPLRDALVTQPTEEAWPGFLENGRRAAEEMLSKTAHRFHETSEKFGRLHAPVPPTLAEEIHLPPAPVLDTAEFLDVAEFELLNANLVERVGAIQRGEAALPAEVDRAELAVAEADLSTALARRTELANTALPLVERRIEGSSTGRIIGRILGELADVGLMFVNPATAGAKVGSLIGKGAKAVKFGIKAKKLATLTRTVRNTLQVAQNANEGSKRLRGTIEEHVPASRGLELLEALSLGYWGEKIGGFFDSPDHVSYVTDPEAVRERQEMLEQIDAELTPLLEKQQRLREQSQQRELSEFLLREQQSQAADLERRIATLKHDAEELHRQQAEDAARSRAESIRRAADQAVQRWLAAHRGYAQAMLSAALAVFRDHWDAEIEGSIEEHVKQIDSLQRSFDEVPEVRRERLTALARSVAILEAALRDLAQTEEAGNKAA